VLEDQLLAEFVTRLNGEAEEKRAELGLDGPLANDLALADVMLAYLEEAGLSAEHGPCPYEDQAGRHQCRILAYALPEDDDRLELFTALHLDGTDSSHVPAKEVGKLAGRAARFFELAGKGDHARFAGHPKVAAAAARIHQDLPRIADVRVHVLTNLRVREQILDRSVSFSVWDLERLYRATGESVTRDRIEIEFARLMGRPIACLEMKPPPSEYQTFLLVLPSS
jgi:hypothetical protein